MELINQHSKKIMEGCKERARDAGLRFDEQTLEYVVTNRDMLELSPKVMIPTLYDYWVHDVEVLKEKGKYELYPGNPYETVINTRPAISFYNDNNPDWLNVMIFYHVLGHIDFFQNNLFFRHTWDYDLAGQALADKRLIARLRSEKGRWVDYVIEFTRGIDNLVGYYNTLAVVERNKAKRESRRFNYFFDVFLQQVRKVTPTEYMEEVARYNDFQNKFESRGEAHFFAEVAKQYPEFEGAYRSYRQKGERPKMDLIEFLIAHSPFLNKTENRWMKSVMQVVRSTSVYFQPQIRSKIMNEGWASYWHETLFLQDERINGHEVDFARIHANVTSMPRVGLNPYALGLRLFQSIEQFENKGHYSLEFERLKNTTQRHNFDQHKKTGRDLIFDVRENYNDFNFINEFVDQDFIDQHQLFVADKRLDEERMVWQYYVKSRSSEDYRAMLMASLYHPPTIEIDDRSTGSDLSLSHVFEGKPLVRDFISNTLLGIEYLWGAPVVLETHEPAPNSSLPTESRGHDSEGQPKPIQWNKVIYRMENRQLSRTLV
ncbi:SpoVR family protein [uncultured Desulfuromonas sp.]|uniref:SpoVR family protein n=1 Tax=uncultured Desulfuromonas sp. TaxID=181013 RepID=UPI002AAAF209|nr:SpoVR family protein [uncultured Desulfuromonas sp.]